MSLKEAEIEDGIRRGILKRYPSDSGRPNEVYIDRDYCTCNTPYWGAGLHQEHCLVTRFERAGKIGASGVLQEIIADRWHVERKGQPVTVILTDWQVQNLGKKIAEAIHEAAALPLDTMANHFAISRGGALKIMLETFADRMGKEIGSAIRGRN